MCAPIAHLYCVMCLAARMPVLSALFFKSPFFAPSSFSLSLRRAAFSAQLESNVGHILAKAAALRINLNMDGAPIASRSHTHPSHSQTSRLLTSSLSLGVPVPRATQCMRDV